MHLYFYCLCLGIAGFNPLANRPKLTNWISKVQSKFSPFYEEAHKVVELTANEFKRFELDKKT